MLRIIAHWRAPVSLVQQCDTGMLNLTLTSQCAPVSARIALLLLLAVLLLE
jgi:hypothetical protein